MGLANTDAGWGWPARLLHWTMAALILFMLGLGFYMTNARLDLTEQFRLVQTHKSWGFVVFTLAVLRAGWRLGQRRTPRLPGHMPGWRRAAARASHALLYALIFVMPLSGWLMASASPLQERYGIENRVFDLFALPDPFIPGDAALAAIFRSVHVISALTLCLVLAIHAGAALKHHFIDRDDVLRRMVSGR